MPNLITDIKTTEVKKHENLVVSRFSLPPLAMKIITIIISTIEEDDPVDKEYILKITDLKNLTKQKSKNIYKLANESLEALLKNPLKIPTESGKGFIRANWISGGVYENGEIRFMIYPKLRPFLFGLKERYLSYDINNILQLKSTYSMKLYELLKDKAQLNSRYHKKAELIIDLEELRDLLSVPKTYQYSSHIKKLILQKAKQELKDKTDLSFDFEEIKEGKRVVKISFKISNKSNTTEKNFVKLIKGKYSSNGSFFAWKSFSSEEWIGIDKSGNTYRYPSAIPLTSSEAKDVFSFWTKVYNKNKKYKLLTDQGRDLKKTMETDTSFAKSLKNTVLELIG